MRYEIYGALREEEEIELAVNGDRDGMGEGMENWRSRPAWRRRRSTAQAKGKVWALDNIPTLKPPSNDTQAER
jgi:hypothetical protein